MERKITNEELTYFHLKYSVSETTIRTIWATANNAEELYMYFEKYLAVVNNPKEMAHVESIAKHMEEA